MDILTSPFLNQGIRAAPSLDFDCGIPIGGASWPPDEQKYPKAVSVVHEDFPAKLVKWIPCGFG